MADITINLLTSRNTVPTLNDISLQLNHNEFFIVAGENNATSFQISYPSDFASYTFYVEMVNAAGAGIQETQLQNGSTERWVVSDTEFVLPEGMAVAGYAYISIIAKLGDNKVVFMPVKLPVKNTIPGWQHSVDYQTDNLYIQDGYLYCVNPSGVSYQVGYVQGERGPRGDIGPGGAGSNPNILINGNFAINQRGEATYTGRGNYSFDRWSLEGDDCTVGQTNIQYSSGGQERVAYITSSQPWKGIKQILESYDNLRGEKITFSLYGRFDAGIRIAIKHRTGSTYADLANADSSSTFVQVTFEVPQDANYDILVAAIYNTGAGTNYIKYAKLEIGEVATSFTPPSYAEELVKCQRYFQMKRGSANRSYIASGIANGTQLFAPYNFNTNMRVHPTIAHYGLIAYKGVIGESFLINDLYFTAFNTYEIDNTTFQCDFVNGTPLASQMYLIALMNENSYISFDAEIY